LIRSIRTYALLVAVPLAGLGAILREGSLLQAPPAIGGEWEVLEPAFPAGLDKSARVLRIEQSGEHVSIARPLEMRGSLRGDSLFLTRVPRALSRDRCMDAGTPRLRARIDTLARPMRLEGAFSNPAVPACGSGRLVAVLNAPR
jgi:hypothetical protein